MYRYIYNMYTYVYDILYMYIYITYMHVLYIYKHINSLCGLESVLEAVWVGVGHTADYQGVFFVNQNILGDV